MSKLRKEEVATWIRELIPFINNPIYLAPKGCFKGEIEVKAGSIIEYDNLLMPYPPTPILQTENLKILVDLYKSLDR